MPREVIMPALGMAQSTGLIVAWLKQPGEKVKAGEALMEVETDKAVMEVEAQADGFLTDVRASAGDTVPVGDVVALISETPAGLATADVPRIESPAQLPTSNKSIARSPVNAEAKTTVKAAAMPLPTTRTEPKAGERRISNSFAGFEADRSAHFGVAEGATYGSRARGGPGGAGRGGHPATLSCERSRYARCSRCIKCRHRAGLFACFAPSHGPGARRQFRKILRVDTL
jgi:pyruvate/2-oxoglutarate dehydrogenase complex dihydrolipoamide acyltransferase (E2) component